MSSFKLLVRLSLGIIFLLIGIISFLIPIVFGWPFFFIAIPILYPMLKKKQ